MIDKRRKKRIDEDIDAELERFVIAQGDKHWTKWDAVRYVLKRQKTPPDDDGIKVIWQSYVLVRASRLATRKRNNKREFESYPVPGEGFRYRPARVMHFEEFRLVVRQYAERKEAATVKHDFVLEVQLEAEQMGLDRGNQKITRAWDAVVERRGDPFTDEGLSEAA